MLDWLAGGVMQGTEGGRGCGHELRETCDQAGQIIVHFQSDIAMV